MSRYLLDTNTVSDYLRRTSSILEARVNDELRGHHCAISVWTRAQLRFGQTGLQPDDRRQSLIDHFLVRLPNLDWTSAAADRYGEIRAFLKKQGAPNGEMDTQIAAHAVAENLILVTHNVRHFERLAGAIGLKLENWLS